MCGIIGYIFKEIRSDTGLLKRMTNLVKHRGPDDEGYFLFSPNCSKGQVFCGYESHPTIQSSQSQLPIHYKHNIGLGHRRYSIIDPSFTGHQPFCKDNNVLIFNGEIYNYIELKQSLERKGIRFFTNTDTEVILAAYHFFGNDCFKQFNGPYAIVIFDRNNQKVVFARDPVGEAPLYFTESEEGFFFSSDIKPLLEALPANRTKVNSLAISDFLYLGIRDYQHQTFWEHIQTLPNGVWMEFDLISHTKKTHTFYKLPNIRLRPSDISFEAALTQFKSLLHQSLAIRMRADQPIGFTLSGGMDSSSLLAIYCQSYTQKVPVVTVKFKNKQHDEEPFARQVAEYYKDKVEYLVVDGFEKDLIHELDYIISIMEEPFLSPNSHTGLHLQRILKSKGIGINMFGAGGDELLAGYPSYLKQYLFHLISSRNSSVTEYSQILKLFLNKAEGRQLLKNYFRKHFKSSKIQPSLSFIKQPKIRNIIPSNDFTTVMMEKFTHHQMNYWMRESSKYFMAVPVEMRAPFLDIDLVDFCFQLPPEFLINQGWQKYILRKSVEKILPDTVVWRKYKMGFPFDLRFWLQKHKNRFYEILSTKQTYYLNLKEIFNQYDHLTNTDAAFLWRMLSLELWYQKIILGEKLSPK